MSIENFNNIHNKNTQQFATDIEAEEWAESRGIKGYVVNVSKTGTYLVW